MVFAALIEETLENPHIVLKDGIEGPEVLFYDSRHKGSAQNFLNYDLYIQQLSECKLLWTN